MKKYKFTTLNTSYSEVVFIDPVITLDGSPLPNVYSIDANNLEISVLMYLEAEGFAKIGIVLDKIKVDDLNYTPESLGDKFAVRLAEFEV